MGHFSLINNGSFTRIDAFEISVSTQLGNVVGRDVGFH